MPERISRRGRRCGRGEAVNLSGFQAFRYSRHSQSRVFLQQGLAHLLRFIAYRFNAGVFLMLELGYALSSEEFGPADLIANARTAESVGFEFALISDHFHPWTNQQRNSPFAWSVIGGISQTVKNLSLGTGVTCPLMRYNPAIIAQAAATSAVMMPGRFFLGLGTGENLNEHITGMHWPPASQRQEMLEEAVAVMRLLWQGGWQTHCGKYYTVEQARIFTMPDEPPPITIAASKPGSAELTGRIGDGLI